MASKQKPIEQIGFEAAFPYGSWSAVTVDGKRIYRAFATAVEREVLKRLKTSCEKQLGVKPLAKKVKP